MTACLACDVLEGRIQTVSSQLLGLMWSDESPWSCTDQEAEAAVEAVRRAWP